MEDYKQKYEQALKRCKEEFNFNNLAYSHEEIKQKLKRVFPELKESEDERIRKEIISFLKEGKPYYCPNSIRRQEWWVWLEKQGEKIDIANKEYWLGYREGKKEILDKYAELEKQGEQKPADKVESKFKFGDWINKDGVIWRIEGVCGKEYILGGRPDVIIQEPIHIIDSEFRLWTIQDAKDGDVLAIEPIKEYPSPFIAIYKERGLDFFNSHCFIAFDGVFHKPTMGHTIDLIHPATKEQRDILFAKMQEAGYEWDSEKKELKKIEEKPEIKDDVLSRFAFYQYDDDAIYLSSLFVRESDRGHGYGSKVLKAAEEVAKTFGISKIRLKVERNTWMEKWYKKNGYEYLSSEGRYDWLENRVIDIKPDKIEQSPVWSEEDEKFFKTALWHISCSVSNGKRTDEHCDTTDWLKGVKERLKFLKERIQPQPKQEWSEEDDLNLNQAIHVCHQYGYFGVEFWLKCFRERMKNKQ